MSDSVNKLADFLYRRSRGLPEDAPVPRIDNATWKAFRRQAKDIMFFLSHQVEFEGELVEQLKRVLEEDEQPRHH